MHHKLYSICFAIYQKRTIHIWVLISLMQVKDKTQPTAKNMSLMCAYKLCRVEFRYWGMQTKLEKFIHDTGESILFHTPIHMAKIRICWLDAKGDYVPTAAVQINYAAQVTWSPLHLANRYIIYVTCWRLTEFNMSSETATCGKTEWI